MRPASIGTHPKKNLITIDSTHTNYKGRKYGAVAYSKPLTEKQVSNYELKEINK